MSTYSIFEKRRENRVYIQIPVICELINAKNKAVEEKTVMACDINSGGIYIESDEAMLLNTEINVRFQLPKSSNIISASVKVVRIEAIGENKFGIGSIFVKLSENDQEEIRQLVERLSINELLAAAIKKNASDLHLLADHSPILRIHGQLEELNIPPLDSADIPKMLYSIMNRQQMKRFEREKELDFGFQYNALTRFRVNVHQQRGFIEATFRLINTQVSSFEELRIPEVVKDLARQKDGLIVIAGPTGCGKTTTIAAMVELINQERKAVIITLERPIEYVHTNAKSIIKQREVGIDTVSFSAAIKSTLKQDPNVIVVGEVDDFETVKTALIAAEAGYLVIISFHAPNAVQAIDRLANMFPTESRKNILFQISNTIRGVIAQLLIPRTDKPGRVLTTEVLIANEAVKKVIRNDEFVQLPTIIQTGAHYKMQTMQDSIKRYIEQGIIDMGTEIFYSEAITRSSR